MQYDLKDKVILITGGNWDAPGVAVKANKNAYNKETQKALWDISAEMTGVRMS